MIYFTRLPHDHLDLLRTMDAHIVNDGISLGERRKLAVVVGTQKSLLCFLGPLRMLRLIMKIQRIFLEKPLLADFTDVTKFFLVAFHMIEHRGLILFCGLARGTDKETRFVLGIGKCHSLGWTCSGAWMG